MAPQHGVTFGQADRYVTLNGPMGMTYDAGATVAIGKGEFLPRLTSHPPPRLNR
jgi:hypothetical protein